MLPLPTLPTASGPFFGRETEIDALRARFEAGARVVTVVGIGGVGKTRLACEYALRHGRAVVFVDLASARDEREVLDAVARALDAPTPRGARDEEARIVRALVSRGETLLVLDNFEQVVDVAALVSRLLARAPATCALVTSRERLRLAHEAVIELAPLQLDGAAGAPAVELFLARMRARRGSPVDEADVTHRASHIVRALEGIPLAIELAADRAALLGLDTVEAWLDRALDLAAAGPRDVPDRQRTLRRTLDASWHALNDDERAVLTACAVFRGTFAAMSVGAVAGSDALDVLQRLREKSLVGSAAAGRLRLLTLVRAYVREQSAPDALAMRAERHADHFAEVTEPARVVLEWDNLAAAFEHRLGTGALEPAARMICALGETAVRTGHVTTLLERIEAVMPADTTTALPTDLACELWLLRARAEERRVRYTAAREAYAQARALARSAGDSARRARVMRVQSVGLAGAGRLDEARALFERAARIAAPGSDGAFEVLGLASALWQARRAPEARTLLEDFLRGATRDSDRALARLELGIIELELGRYEASHAHLVSALDVFTRAGWRAEMARCEVLLGLVAHHRDAFDVAEAHHLRSAALVDDGQGGRGRAGYARGYLGVLQLERGRLDATTRALLIEGRDRVPDAGHAALFAGYLAALDAARGDVSAAVASWKVLRAVDVAPCLVGTLEALGLYIAVAEATFRARADARPLRVAMARATQAMGRAARAEGDARLALRIVGVLLARHASATPMRTSLLEVHATGAWFRRDRGERVDLSRHGNARRALVCLAEARVVAPGGTVPWSTLVARVWPGESMLQSAAKNRLRVTMALLRRAGLDRVLVTDTAGYRLGADVSVTMVAASSPTPLRVGGARG